MRRSNPDFLNGVPELLTIRLLSNRPMHGYQLVQALKVATGGSLTFGEGCIYPILHRLESDKMLRSRRVTVEGRERLVYEVTAKGRQRLNQSISTWQNIAQAVARALEGTNDAITKLA